MGEKEEGLAVEGIISIGRDFPVECFHCRKAHGPVVGAGNAEGWGNAEGAFSIRLGHGTFAGFHMVEFEVKASKAFQAQGFKIECFKVFG